MLARRYRASRVVVPAVLSLLADLLRRRTNFAVWAFSGMYSLDMAGLVQCYVAALPFLKYTVAGDLFWAAVLFGGAWLVQRLHARSGTPRAPSSAARNAPPQPRPGCRRSDAAAPDPDLVPRSCAAPAPARRAAGRP